MCICLRRTAFFTYRSGNPFQKMLPPPPRIPGRHREHAPHLVVLFVQHNAIRRNRPHRMHPLFIHTCDQAGSPSPSIEPPKILRLPRRHRIRMHRRSMSAYVNSVKHPQQPPAICTLSRKSPHRGRIKNVPPQRRRHLQMHLGSASSPAPNRTLSISSRCKDVLASHHARSPLA